MKTLHIDFASEKDNAHNVSVRTLFDTEHAQVIHIELKPGESLRKHITPVDVLFYILEGKGMVEIGNESKEVSRDMLIESPTRIPYRLINNGEKTFRFLVVKTPKPIESTHLL